MEKIDAITALSALSQELRLDIFRLLVRVGSEGIVAGDIAQALGCRANTLSNNLNVLSHAGLIHSRREGRSVRYFARIEGMRALLAFLMEDCCAGRPELCAPLPGLELECLAPAGGALAGCTGAAGQESGQKGAVKLSSESDETPGCTCGGTHPALK